MLRHGSEVVRDKDAILRGSQSEHIEIAANYQRSYRSLNLEFIEPVRQAG
jgi:hypothetical protein